MTYLGLKAVTGVFLASSLYFVIILLADILEFGNSKTSAILEAGRLWVSDVLGIRRSALLVWVVYHFHVLMSVSCYFCLRLGVVITLSFSALSDI